MREIITLTLKQSRRVNSLIKKMWCNFDDGHCILLDDGDPCVCPQLIIFSHIICNHFRFAVLPGDKDLYIELTKPKNSKNVRGARKSICRKEINLNTVIIAENQLQKSKLPNAKENSVLCHGIEIKKSLKIRLCNKQKRKGNILYSKPSKMHSYCVTKKYTNRDAILEKNIFM